MKNQAYFQQMPIPHADEVSVVTGDSGLRQEEAARTDEAGTCPGKCGLIGVGGGFSPYKIVSGLILVFSALLAVPVLFFYFLYPAAQLEELRLLGIGYSATVHIYLLGAVVLMVWLIFYLRLKAGWNFLLFLLLLVGCLPLLAGLRSDLSLAGTVTAMPFFHGWPVFLNPLYLLFQVLLPLGFFLACILQIRGRLKGKSYGYAFLAAGLFMAGAGFIGVSGLDRAGYSTVFALFKTNAQAGSIIAAGRLDDAGRQAEPAVGGRMEAGRGENFIAAVVDKGMQSEVKEVGIRPAFGGESQVEMETRLSRLLGDLNKKFNQLEQREELLIRNHQDSMRVLEERVALLDVQIKRILALNNITVHENAGVSALPVEDENQATEEEVGAQYGDGLTRINTQLDRLEKRMAEIAGRLAIDSTPTIKK